MPREFLLVDAHNLIFASPDLAEWGSESRKRALEFFDARLCANQLLEWLTRSLPSAGSEIGRAVEDKS
jgi:4'-phosphopantetheinyl transferase EntD